MNILSVMRIAKRKMKRHIYIYLFSGRVQKQLELREGSCLQCGRCCKLAFRCPMLVGETPHSRCRIYNHRSKVCMQFPISEEDLMDVNYQCGHSFRAAEKVVAKSKGLGSDGLPPGGSSSYGVMHKDTKIPMLIVRR
jgi:hypothetical protein